MLPYVMLIAYQPITVPGTASSSAGHGLSIAAHQHFSVVPRQLRVVPRQLRVDAGWLRVAAGKLRVGFQFTVPNPRNPI